MRYHQLGEIPPKRHTVFKKPGNGIYYEELMGNLGFQGRSSILYHVHRPTQVKSTRTLKEQNLEEEKDRTLRMRHFRTAQMSSGGSAVLDRVPVMFNSDVTLFLAHPDRQDDFFYRNAQADELVYVAQGEGVLETRLGELEFRQGDYLTIPRFILHRYRFTGDEIKLFIMESAGEVLTPKRYRNEFGQHIERSPFCERDLRLPENLQTHDEKGEFKLVIKQRGRLNEVILDHHPCDVVGWDGYYYPFAFNIEDFEPIVGRIHEPPPVHQTFQAPGFVVCSFVPRPYDFDKQAVPAPYHHANVMTDEVLFYCSENFMSRKGVEFGSITLHPDGLTHGPQPGRTEASIGQEWTDELAVMVDTFKPLKVAKPALEIEDRSYETSWLE